MRGEEVLQKQPKWRKSLDHKMCDGYAYPKSVLYTFYFDRCPNNNILI